jgi:hypothetical protein
MDEVLFTDDQRAAILDFLTVKRNEGYTLDQVIEEMEAPIENYSVTFNDGSFVSTDGASG